jgi:Spy/CpxP family protein refolding chaperone
MANENLASQDQPVALRRRLVTWPLALIGMTLAVLLVANTVSAWGRGDRDGHDIEDIKSHAEHFVGRALDRLDATDEQTAAIQTIVMATIDELNAARGEIGSGRGEFIELMTAPTIDRAALEELRLTHLERANVMTQIVAANLADVMDVLTPEQRIRLEEHLEKHHGRHGRHGWGGL